MAFALSLLTGGLGLLKTYWKWFLLAGVVIGLFLWHQHAIKAYGEQQFKNGVEATLKQVKTAVGNTNAFNRSLEQNTATNLDNFGSKTQKEDDVRKDNQQKAQDKLGSVVDSVPMWKSAECSVTPQVLAERNAIRSLGPDAVPLTPLATVTPPTVGATK